MSNDNKTYGNILDGFRRLQVAIQENTSRLPDIGTERVALDTALIQAQEAKSRQDLHTAGKQRATQDLKGAIARGKDAARQIQSAAKFKLGSRDELLIHFQVAPLRKHGPRKTAAAKQPTTTPVIP
jgi:hypothetical protein